MHSRPLERRKSPVMLSSTVKRPSPAMACMKPACRSRMGVESSVPVISTMFRWSAPMASAFFIRNSPARRPSARKSAPM